MALELVTIPCLSDNYAYLIRDKATGETALVDVPEAAPILAELALRGWRLDKIFLTHHHHDHVQGTDELVQATGAAVYGAQADVHRLPPLTRALTEGDEVTVGETIGHVMDVSGHTIGDIAFVFPSAHMAFTADSLMAGLRSAGHVPEFANLRAEDFDPRLPVADEPDWEDPDKIYSADTLAEQARIARNDAIAFVFPVWWWSVPATTKGWIDRVWNNGWAYG